MAFPRINMASYQFYVVGGLIMLASFFVPGGAAKSGWTSYSPLATVADLHRPNGQTFWLIGMVCLINSSLLGSVNFISTIVQLRVKGLGWMRLPFFVWAQFVTAFLLLLAFPPLEAAGFLQLSDNLLDTSFFLPTGLVVSGTALHVSGGGSPLLWQHLFWFLAHPEVYVLILPAMGIVTEIIANNTRKPIWGYRSMVYGALVIGFLSFIVWAHHMYLTGSVHPFHRAYAVRAGVSADVRDRGSDGAAAGVQCERHHAARHLLRDRAFSLHCRAGDHFCAVRRDLLLVSEGDGAVYE
jgi:cytochrome c oxidase subunit 1